MRRHANEMAESVLDQAERVIAAREAWHLADESEGSEGDLWGAG